MSYVGEPYEYDVFVSYSHGTASTDQEHKRRDHTLRDWSRSFVDKLADNLSIRLNTDLDASRTFSYFLDQREFDSAEPISSTIREAAADSALILILASPYYLGSSYCLEEVSAFFEQARRDGRGLQHCIIREIQPTREEEWPTELRGDDQRVVNRGEPLFDAETQLPIDLDTYRETRLTPNLSGPRSKLTVTIGNKLKELREQAAARRVLEKMERERARVEELARAAVEETHGPALDPDLERKTIYLQAEFESRDAWRRVKDRLGRLVLVNPNNLQALAEESEGPDEVLSLLATFDSRRRKMLRLCNGLVLLRARPDDDIEMQLLAARQDRVTLRQALRRDIPWALVDEVDDEGPELTGFTIPRVVTSSPDWPERLIGALGFAAPDSAGP